MLRSMMYVAMCSVPAYRRRRAASAARPSACSGACRYSSSASSALMRPPAAARSRTAWMSVEGSASVVTSSAYARGRDGLRLTRRGLQQLHVLRRRADPDGELAHALQLPLAEREVERVGVVPAQRLRVERLK